MDSGSIPRIDKLMDENFHWWKQKVKLVLSYHEIDDTLEETSIPDHDSEYRQAWNRNNKKAMDIIGLSLSDAHFHQVEGAQPAHEMWRIILNIFERHTFLKKITARRKFYTVTMLNSETILRFTNRVRQLATTIESMGVEIDES